MAVARARPLTSSFAGEAFDVGEESAGDRENDFEINCVAGQRSQKASDLRSAILLSIGRDVMPNRVALGIGGLEAEPGDHICGVFSSEAQRDQVLIPLLQAGLASGDKCICVVDGTPPGEIVAALGPAGQAAALTVGKQLEVYGAPDLLLRSGSFSADEVIGAWKAAVSAVMYSAHFDLVRAVQVWSGRDVLPSMAELLLLESEMNRYLPLYPQVMVCLYDMNRFGGDAFMNLVMTHPRVLVNGAVIENPHFMTPDGVLAKGTPGVAGPVTPVTEEAKQWFSGVMTG